MNKVRKVLCFLTVLVVILSTAVTASAGSVTYKGQAEKFVYQPGSEYSPTDLFTDFRGVMPGDSLVQDITVKNAASDKVNVEIFIRALGASELSGDEGTVVSQEQSDDFLKEMTLTVTQKGKSELFDAPANQTAQLTDWVSMGSFKSGAEADLQVTLNVPVTMGNDFKEKIGALQWQFKVIETPVPANAVQTGDDSDMIVPLSLMGIAALALFLALFAKRRKKEQ